MDDRAERSLEELRREAHEVVGGKLSVGQFVADLDWALPGIGRRGGVYAPQATALIADALDHLVAERIGLSLNAPRALVEASALAAEDGNDPGSVARVHSLLVGAGLLGPSTAPAPRPRLSAAAGGPPGRPSRAERATEAENEPVDAALDQTIAHMTRRMAPNRSALAPLRLLGLGWVIVLTLVMGVLAGVWVDGQLGISPLGAIVGMLLGLLGAGLAARSLVRQSRSL